MFEKTGQGIGRLTATEATGRMTPLPPSVAQMTLVGALQQGNDLSGELVRRLETLEVAFQCQAPTPTENMKLPDPANVPQAMAQMLGRLNQCLGSVERIEQSVGVPR